METHAEKFSHYDTADYLTDDERIAEYLEAVLEEAEDDSVLIAQALGAVARARNMSQLARETGLTREGLYKALPRRATPALPR